MIYEFMPKEKQISIHNKLKKLDGCFVRVTIYNERSLKAYEGRIEQDGKGFHFYTDDGFMKGEADIFSAIESGKYRKITLEEMKITE
ncbi:MAG TPA: hypothetical protein VJB11_02285 [archaeon]|nr:hypothetical protein [archaeon]